MVPARRRTDINPVSATVWLRDGIAEGGLLPGIARAVLVRSRLARETCRSS
jgi:hypothetical protein